MPWVRIASLLFLIATTACTESEMSPGGDQTTLGRAVAAAEELLAGLPPLCSTLRTGGYETRKTALDDTTGTQLRLIEEACPDDVARLTAGREVEAAAADVDGERARIDFRRCAATTTGFEARIRITNRGSVPIGVYAVVRPTSGGDKTGVGGLVVVWHLTPGASAARDVTGSGSGDRCSVDYNVYLADRSLAGDGAAAVPASPELAADDPAVWFPALVGAERAWSGPDAADIDGPSRTEDLRSTAYPALVDAVRNGGTATPTAGGTLCSATAKSDDPTLVRVVSRRGDTLVAGLVRRGHDRGWRWLGSPLTLGPGPCPS